MRLNRIAALAAVIIIAMPVSPSPKKKARAQAEEVTTEIEESPAVADEMLQGEWMLYNIQGRKVVGEERPYLTFDLGQRLVYGNNGCNTINATIEGGADGAIAFINPLATMAHCDNAPYEFLFNTTLNTVTGFRISQYGHEYYLDLLNQRGQVVMVLRRHNMEFLDGVWRVASIYGDHNSNENIELVIDTAEHRIHGNTGCNIINGRLFIDPDKTNSMQFHRLATTRAACPDRDVEMALLIALEETESALAVSADEVRLLNNRGEEIITLRRPK